MQKGSIRHLRRKLQIPWYDEAGNRRSAAFDTKDEAELELSRRVLEIEEVRRGFHSAPPKPHTLSELNDLWLSTRGAKKRSRATDVSFIRVHLRPFFGEMLVGQIHEGDIEHLKASRPAETRVQQNTVNHHMRRFSATSLRAAEGSEPTQRYVHLAPNVYAAEYDRLSPTAKLI